MPNIIGSIEHILYKLTAILTFNFGTAVPRNTTFCSQKLCKQDVLKEAKTKISTIYETDIGFFSTSGTHRR